MNRWFKLYRHARCDVAIFSQSFEDMDKKLRILANRYFLVERSLIPKCIRVRRISKRIYINEVDKQIIDAYDFVPFTRRIYFGPKYWKHFDSFIMPAYPAKDWNVFGNRTQTALTESQTCLKPAVGTNSKKALRRIRNRLQKLYAAAISLFSKNIQKNSSSQM